MKVKTSRKKVVIPPNTELCEWEKIRAKNIMEQKDLLGKLGFLKKEKIIQKKKKKEFTLPVAAVRSSARLKKV